MKCKLRLVLCLYSILLISGCGWQLRGNTNLSNIDSVAITAQIPYSDFIDILTHEFHTSQVAVKKSEEASYNLVIMELYEEQRTIGIDGSGRAAKYLLIQTIDFMIYDQQGNPLSEMITRRVEQSFDHDESRALAKENERNILQREMHQSLANHVIRALSQTVKSQPPQ